MKKSLLLLVFITGSLVAWSQVNLVTWTFPSGTNSDSLPSAGLSMNSGFGFRAPGASVINYSTNGATTYCAQATNWDNGMDIKYWSFRLYSAGYAGLTVSCTIRSGGNNPGPRDFKLQYRILPGQNWTDVPGTQLVAANNWTSGVLNNVALPSALDNQQDIIELRLVMTSNTNASNGTVASTGISKIDNVSVYGNPLSGGISGHALYHNAMQTALKNVAVSLLNGGNIVGTTQTDSLGYYSFSGLAPGTYHIQCSSANTWGGVNAVDALKALRHFVGFETLTGLYLKAADVDNSGNVNASDALKISLRFTGMITSFNTPDWLFEEFDVVVGNAVVDQPVFGLCSGDVNGSDIPQ